MTVLIQGTLNVEDPCSSMADGGYSDISAGAQVKVTGSKGQTLAVAPLGSGTDNGDGTCGFPFIVHNVRGGQSVYGVTVSHRGTVDFMPSEVLGSLTMTLGG